MSQGQGGSAKLCKTETCQVVFVSDGFLDLPALEKNGTTGFNASESDSKEFLGED